jgi:hypothetical protein
VVLAGGSHIGQERLELLVGVPQIHSYVLAGLERAYALLPGQLSDWDRRRQRRTEGAVAHRHHPLYLGRSAARDDLDATFYTVQAVELVAGALNITLLPLNIRYGLRLTGRLRRKSRSTRAAAAPQRTAGTAWPPAPVGPLGIRRPTGHTSSGVKSLQLRRWTR